MLQASYPGSGASGHPVGGVMTLEFLELHKQGDSWGWNRPACLAVARCCDKNQLEAGDIWRRFALGARP